MALGLGEPRLDRLDDALGAPHVRPALVPVCFNLFGELYRAANAAATLWETGEADPVEVRFEWSPGRREADYLGDRTAFDASLVVGP